MDISEIWRDPEMLYLAAGAACLGAGAALVQAYRNLQNGNGWVKRAAMLATASALLFSGPLFLVRGF